MGIASCSICGGVEASESGSHYHPFIDLGEPVHLWVFCVSRGKLAVDLVGIVSILVNGFRGIGRVGHD